MKFKKVESHPSFPALEGQVLARWQRENTFKRSLERTKGSPEYIFYDGPPFATGNPHHGTIFVSILKDVIPRYKTMRGNYVPRTWGWDCHGLPIETAAEKNLGITEKSQILNQGGVKAFNDECRRIVSEYNESWKIYIDRIGRWVDMEKPYRTLDRDFMESVIWSFAESYKKGLIYKDYRVSPYCYRCETPLSISDTRLDDATRPKQDRTVTVKFAVKDKPGTFLLAWTTTPWTLPSNLALGVGPKVEYSFVSKDGETYILASDCLKSYQAEFGKAPTVVEKLTGEELLARGYSYAPLFPYAAQKNPNGFKLLSGDFISTDDGTGIVHLAPAFGEDDYWTCRKANIQVFAPVDDKGRFTAEVTDFAGQNVHDSNGNIIKHLKAQNAVVRDQTVEHNYPHCWRCRTALIYRALDAWYFKVEAIKEQLLANNQEINWYPETVKNGRFGNWLENARDWNISRNRFWATPIPVWECDKCGEREVLGSVKEIEERAKKPVPDLHKEYLDEVSYACKCGSGKMTHAKEVLDCWFESGSMPYGQFYYPFERADHFRSHFPADFIVEYTGQIRGWFYVLHILSTALFNKPAFKNCLVHGTLLAADGKKMSKSQKNFTDPLVLMDKYGADAMRAYLLSSNAVMMSDMSFRDDGVDSMVKSIILPLWNALSFFTSYAEIDGIDATELALEPQKNNLQQLDHYILSESERLVRAATTAMDDYRLNDATRLLPEFLETLNNWYIRRSRFRVWSADPRAPEKMAFYATLNRVLTRFVQVLAPFCPFIADAVWERLGNSESVHLTDWPKVDAALINDGLSEEIGFARRIISAGLAIRAREKIRVRQPLARLRLALQSKLDLKSYGEAITEELNVKAIEVVTDPGEIAERIGKANSKVLGPKYGGSTQEIIKLVKEGKFEELPDRSIKVGEFTLAPGEIEIVFQGREGLAVESVTGAVVALDLKITPELELEGRARDLVRQIQDLRKEADLNISDRIRLAISGAEDILTVHQEYVKNETLTRELAPALESPLLSKVVDIGGKSVEIRLARV